MKRRNFNALPLLSFAGFVAAERPARAEVFPANLRKQPPHEQLEKFIAPGTDEFAVEKSAMQVERALEVALRSGSSPLATGFRGISPLPVRYRRVHTDIEVAEWASAEAPDFTSAWKAWTASLGKVTKSRFYGLAGSRVRFEIQSRGADGATIWRTGEWELHANAAGKWTAFKPLSESKVSAAAPRFVDATAELLGAAPAFRDQLAKGIPYWRARLDSACGIDVYGTNGIAVGDIDNDGFDEVYVCQPGGLPNRLLKRYASGKFDDISEAAGVAVLDNTSSALFADFRNAGVQDLVVLASSGPIYFRNLGNSKFEHVPGAFAFKRPASGTFTGVAAADYDRDGKLDLYLCTYIYFQNEDQYRYPVPYHDAQHGPPNVLFRNRSNAAGEIAFEDVTQESGIDHNNNRYSFAAAWCDYDADGFPELYVANDFGRNNLYKFDGTKFRDIAAEAGVEDIGPGMSAAWFDADGDGRDDLYVANMWSPSGQRVSSSTDFPPVKKGAPQEAYRRHAKGNSLYRNLGGGRFAEAGERAGLELGRWAWSADAHDFDNDGAPEVYIAAGMITNGAGPDLMSFFWRQVVAKSPADARPAPEYEAGWNAINQWIREDYSWNGGEPNVFYLRDSEDRFHDASGVSGLDFADDSRSFAVTDFDGDGNLDVFLKSRRGPQIRAMRNVCGARSTKIAFDLVGTESNRDAIGARVTVHTARGQQSKQVAAGSGFLSQHTKRLHFGLGDARVATRVEVRWPSGAVQQLVNLEAGFRYRIRENLNTPVQRVPFRAPVETRTAAGAIPGVDNRPALSGFWLLQPLPLPEKHTGPAYLILTNKPVQPPYGAPAKVLDLSKLPDSAAGFALFRRYAIDWRGPLELPLTLLIDRESRVHKLYASIPDAAQMKADLARLESTGDRVSRALPFPGKYFLEVPTRNYYRFGGAFLGAGYPEFAQPYLEEAIRVWPENAKAHATLGRLHLDANRLDEAAQNLRRALQINPNAPDVWNDLGGVSMSRGEFTAAESHFEKALSINPDLPYVLANAGQAAMRLNKLPQAEQFLRRALEADAKDSDTTDRLGLLLAKQGRHAEAKSLFQHAIELDPKNASAINNIGVLYLEMGQARDARAAFEFGIRQSPGNETLTMNLARVYVQSGLRELARDLLRDFLKTNPSSSIARRALAQLE